MTAVEAPRFSVIIPTYQRVELLPRSVGSVLGQDYESFELIVVDDGSSDGTAEWLAAQEDPRLHAIRQPNRGVSAARNAGSRRARGAWLTFLDSDDEAMPSWLSGFAREIRTGVALVSCAHIATSGRPGGPGETVVQPVAGDPTFCGLAVSLLAGSFAIRRELFDWIGGYDEALIYGESTEMLARAALECAERGLEGVSTPRPLRYHHAGVRRPTRREARARLDAASVMLARHGDRMDRTRQAISHAIQAVGNARLGRWSDARRQFAAALRKHPHAGYAVRWAMAAVPWLGRRVWPLASDRDDADESTPEPR